MRDGSSKPTSGALPGAAGSGPACYRYRTSVLVGPWRRRPEQALEDALDAGLVLDSDGEAQWRVPGEIEQSLCDEPGPCGGAYPSPD